LNGGLSASAISLHLLSLSGVQVLRCSGVREDQPEHLNT
jgi:hypothetical protein